MTRLLLFLSMALLLSGCGSIRREAGNSDLFRPLLGSEYETTCAIPLWAANFDGDNGTRFPEISWDGEPAKRAQVGDLPAGTRLAVVGVEVNSPLHAGDAVYWRVLCRQPDGRKRLCYLKASYPGNLPLPDGLRKL